MTTRDLTIEKVKLARRIKHAELDSEINDLIDACLTDIEITVGVESPSEDDPMILTAIKLFCCGHLTRDEKETEQFFELYDKLKMTLQVSSRYGAKRCSCE